MTKLNKKEMVPVVVLHAHEDYNSRVYRYQVYIAEYCRDKHTPKNISKNYEMFSDIDEVNAYIKGLEVSGVLYEGKRSK